MVFKIVIPLSIICVLWFGQSSADMPCAAMPITNKSVVCVCNSTYCDTVTTVVPTEDTYVTYTSSKDGLRFHKEVRQFKDVSRHNNDTLVLDPNKIYQTIIGFGGAVTDSAGINWKNLSPQLQKYLINSYFSDEGLQYNMIRLPIGGTDFSTHPYAFNLQPENDTFLSNFSLAPEDFEYKIPMIKAAMQASKTMINVLGTTWSPPPWMKSNHNYTGFSQLKPEYYSTYALYHLKFLESYASEGIKVWGITTTNEPTNGMIGIPDVNCLGWNAGNMGKWIINNLGPMIRNSKFKDLMILAGDDQRLTIPYWFNYLIRENTQVLDYINGMAVHYYTDFVAPPMLLTELSLNFPDKFIMSTEGCTGSGWFVKNHVVLGSWNRAKRYIQDIITDLNYNVTGWIDWNLCLNEHGGPTWTGNYVDSPIIVFPEKGVFIKQPMFYAFGQFTKFIPRGSKRIKVIAASSWGSCSVAFLTPYNTIVVIIYNDGEATTVNIQLGSKLAVIDMVPQSVTTAEFLYHEEMK